MEIRTRKDFINALFEFFNTKNTDSLFQTYETLLKCDFSVDWNAFYLHIAKNAEYKTLPMPKLFIDLLPKFKKNPIVQSTNVGSTIRVQFKSGIYYDFVSVSGEEGTTISDVLKKDSNNIESIIEYPPGVTIINNQVFYPYIDGYQENSEEWGERQQDYENRLARQVKKLYVA